MILALALPGCAPVRMQSGLRAIGRPAEADAFGSARHNPLSAAAHYETAMGFVSGPSVTRGDLEMALSGFQTSARLAPDLWEPLAGAALVAYHMGNFRAALDLMGQAIERRGEPGPLAVPFALLAYRAGEPELARSALNHADHLPSQNAAGQQFLEAAFAGSGWRPLTIPPAAPQLVPQTPKQTQKQAQAQVQKTPVPPPPPAGESAANPGAVSGGPGVIIEAYLIRETRQSAGGRGLNLLDGLAIQFGGTLLNYSYDMAAASGDSRTGNLTVTAPAINYSLNLASNDRSHVTLEASPLVLAREGHKSKFLEGGSVMIVPLSDHTQPVERDIGVTLEVTPQRVGATDVDLDVVLEMSNITGQSVVNAGRGASLLETDKTHVEVSARVPYGKAIVVGSGDSLNRRSNDNRSGAPIDLPGLSRRDVSVGRRDVLVVLTVRAPDGQNPAAHTAGEWNQILFGLPLPPFAQYGRRPSETPAPSMSDVLPLRLY